MQQAAIKDPGGKGQGDSSGAEQQSSFAEVHGDPAAWAWTKPLSLGLMVTRDHLRFWGSLALLNACLSLVPFLELFTWPVMGLLVIGASLDIAHGRSEPTLRGVWGRWSPRLGAVVANAVLLSVATMLVMLLPAAIGFGGMVGLRAVGLGGQAYLAWCLAAVVGIIGLFLVGRVMVFAGQEVVLGERSTTDAWRRAYWVFMGNHYGVAGVALAIGFVTVGAVLVTGVAVGVVAVPVGFVTQAAPGPVGALVNLGLGLIMGIAVTLVMNWTGAAWTFLYVRESARHDRVGR